MLVDALTVHRERKAWAFLLNSFVLGIGSYLLYYGLVRSAVAMLNAVGVEAKGEIHLFQSLVHADAELNVMEVLLVGILALPFALAISAVTNHKLLHRLACSIGVTKKFGDADVWSYMMNTRDVDWVVVRDFANDLVYEGWAAAFSDIQSPRELLLRDVSVRRNSTREELYKVGGLYVSLGAGDVTLEVPSLGDYEERFAADGGEETVHG